jgi:hypothetical protein
MERGNVTEPDWSGQSEAVVTDGTDSARCKVERASTARRRQPSEETMADRDNNLGNTGSDEGINPDSGRDQDSGMSGSERGSDSDSGSSQDTDTSRDRSTGDSSTSGDDLSGSSNSKISE